MLDFRCRAEFVLRSMVWVFMVLNRIFDVIHIGTGPNARHVFVVLLSVISAILFLFILKKTSNQIKIQHHKDQIVGNILQIRLYQDSFGVLISGIVNILKHNLWYLTQMIVPILLICIPLVLLTVQINNHCGYEPLKVNQRFIIQAVLDTYVIFLFTLIFVFALKRSIKVTI